MKRLEVRISEHVDARLEQMKQMFGMERQQILLAAFAQYMPDIQPAPKRKTSTQKDKEKPSLGSGTHAKNVQEVIDYFRHRGVPEPVEPKAQLFFDHYQSMGWKSGRNTFKHWGLKLKNWTSKNPDWEPKPKTEKKPIKMSSFLKWAKEFRPPVYEKYRQTKSISEVDEYYIDEYTNR